MPASTTVNQETISSLSIHQEIAIAAPIEIAWEAVLDQMGRNDEARRYYASALKIMPGEPRCCPISGYPTC